MAQYSTIATGLRFPEGPVAMPDGSILLTEMNRQTLTRVSADGEVSVVAELPGGPNGCAIGPDGHAYICNNGGFEWVEASGYRVPGHAGANYRGGSIQRVNLATGAVETLYAEYQGKRLKGPNDIVFDRHGGFWFSDHGKSHGDSDDVGAIYYAHPDGSFLTQQIFPHRHPNGVGLSPDGSVLYVAETFGARLFGYPIVAPGRVDVEMGLFAKSYLLDRAVGNQLYDSIAIEADGNICVGTIIQGGIVVTSPNGNRVEFVDLPDPAVTNICFGGPDMRTAFIVFSAEGRLISMDWPRPGLKLVHQR